MWYVEKSFKVIFGGNIFTNVPMLIAYRGQPLFQLHRHDETGYLGISFKLYDETGRHLATVKHNEPYQAFPDAIAVDGSANGYTIREKATGAVIATINKRPNTTPAELEVTARLYTPDGQLIDATPDGLHLPNHVVFQNLEYANWDVAFSIVRPNDPPYDLHAAFTVHLPE